MKKYLLSQTGNFYKANLHCHSTVSDGKWSPERIKAEYMANGYSIIAYTDHDKMVCHNELTDENFLAMNGYELAINEPGEPGFYKMCHICFVALSPNLQKENCYDFISEHTPKCISEQMQKGRENGYFVTYNHPTWSLETYEDYSNYDGMDAMEIYNNSSATLGFDEYNARVYDDIVKSGKRVYCIATDDNHNAIGDSFGGFTVIKAPRLDYESVAKALKAGQFYASEGPQIFSLTLEDNIVKIECSNAVKIALVTGVIYAQARYGTADEPITNAEFTIFPDHKYFRIIVTDKTGKRAYTNAYFMEDIF